MRSEPRDTSELVSQVIYGETFKIVEQRSSWSLIKLTFDGYKGWIDNKQLIKIDKTTYESIISKKNIYSSDLIEFIQLKENGLLTIPLGSNLKNIEELERKFLNDENHSEYEELGHNIERIRENIKNKSIDYNHHAKQNSSDRFSSTKLEIINLRVLPNYIKKNFDKYKEWFA